MICSFENTSVSKKVNYLLQKPWFVRSKIWLTWRYLIICFGSMTLLIMYLFYTWLAGMVPIREQGFDPTRLSPNSPYVIDYRVYEIDNTNITDHRSYVYACTWYLCLARVLGACAWCLYLVLVPLCLSRRRPSSVRPSRRPSVVHYYLHTVA